MTRRMRRHAETGDGTRARMGDDDGDADAGDGHGANIDPETSTTSSSLPLARARPARGRDVRIRAPSRPRLSRALDPSLDPFPRARDFMSAANASTVAPRPSPASASPSSSPMRARVPSPVSACRRIRLVITHHARLVRTVVKNKKIPFTFIAHAPRETDRREMKISRDETHARVLLYDES